jgi:hypothetical protein
MQIEMFGNKTDIMKSSHKVRVVGEIGKSAGLTKGEKNTKVAQLGVDG